MDAADGIEYLKGMKATEEVVILPTRVFRVLRTNWLGAPGEAMLINILGVNFPFGDDSSHPITDEDFRLCCRLMILIPQLRSELHKMKSVSPEWAALVRHWSELEDSLSPKHVFGGPSPLSKKLEQVLSLENPSNGGEADV